MAKITYLSVIVPVYNEEENLLELMSDLDEVLSKIGIGHEILAINDGSTDASKKILEKLSKTHKNVRLINLRKNFGKSTAYMVGFIHAKGDICVTVDADGQDVPAEIPKMLSLIEKGYDVVVGWRKKRADPFIKRVNSLIWNSILTKFSGVNIHDSNCGLKAFRKKCLSQNYFRGDFHRYLPVIIAMDGFKVTEIKVIHQPRKKGESKYNFTRIFPALFDFFTGMFLAKYSNKPMHFFGLVGLVIFFIGMIINFYLFIVKISGHAIGGRPLLIFGLLLTISGLQFFLTGLLGDLVIRGRDANVNDYLSHE